MYEHLLEVTKQRRIERNGFLDNVLFIKVKFLHCIKKKKDTIWFNVFLQRNSSLNVFLQCQIDDSTKKLISTVKRQIVEFANFTLLLTVINNKLTKIFIELRTGFSSQFCLLYKNFMREMYQKINVYGKLTAFVNTLYINMLTYSLKNVHTKDCELHRILKSNSNDIYGNIIFAYTSCIKFNNKEIKNSRS